MARAGPGVGERRFGQVGRIQATQFAQVCLEVIVPGLLASPGGGEQGRRPAAAGCRLAAKPQPKLRCQIEADDPFLGARSQLRLAARAGAGQEAKVAALAAAGTGQLFDQPAGALQVPDPEQAAQAAAVHHQGERLGEPFCFRRQPLQGEAVGHRIGGMAAMADLVESSSLSGAQSRRPTCQHGLFHGVSVAADGVKFSSRRASRPPPAAGAAVRAAG